jgi:hypothetical protein
LAVNDRVWKLVEGFLQAHWRGILVTWVPLVAGAGSASFAGSRGTGVFLWFAADAMRMVLVSVPLCGFFFGEREVATLPVSTKGIWRARWLLATVGVTLLTTSARWVAARFLPGSPFDATGFSWMTAIEFGSAGTCAAAAAFLLKTSELASLGSAARWVASLTWVSMPLWCSYLRLHSPSMNRGLSPAFAAAIAALAVASYWGFRIVPSTHVARLLLSVDARRATHLPASSGPNVWGRPTGPRNGATGWAFRQILRAVCYGLGGALFIAAIAASINGGTFLQSLGGMFGADDSLGPWAYSVPSIVWLGSAVANARLLRTVPISAWTQVRILTIAQGASWATMWLVQAGAYRLTAGVWPSSPPLASFFVVLALLAVSKTFFLLLGGRYFLIGVIVVLQTSVFAAVRLGVVAEFDATQAAAASIGIISLLMLADLTILNRNNRLYRHTASIG